MPVRTLFTLALVLVTLAALDASAQYDPNLCQSHLKSKKLTACPANAHPHSVPTQAYCRNMDPYVPLQTVICQHKTTGKVKSSDLASLVMSCQDLDQQDPDWDLVQCYVCCADAR